MSETGYGGDSNLFRKERENHVLSEPKVSLLTETRNEQIRIPKMAFTSYCRDFYCDWLGVGDRFSFQPARGIRMNLLFCFRFPGNRARNFYSIVSDRGPAKNRQTLSSLDCSSSFSSFSRASLFVRLFHFFIQLDKRDGDTVWREHPDSISSRMLKYEGYEDPTQVIKTCDGISIVWIVRINLTLGWNFTALWQCESAMIRSMTKFISRDG